MAQDTQDRTQDRLPSGKVRLTQDKRIGVLTTPLGKDVLVLVRFDGSEGLSELFEFRIEALSEEPDINFDKAIGQQCTLKFKTYPTGGSSSSTPRTPFDIPNRISTSRELPPPP